MAASNPSGEMAYWFNGAPFPGAKLGSQDTGEMQFWFNGAPIVAIYPTTVTTVGGPLVSGRLAHSTLLVGGRLAQ